MFDGLFDKPWLILVIVILFVVMFGSRKLPGAARSLGQSMRILKKEVQGLHEDEPESRPLGAQPAVQAPAEVTVGASDEQPAQQAQTHALPQQIGDLQRAASRDAGPKTPAAAAEASTRQPI